MSVTATFTKDPSSRVHVELAAHGDKPARTIYTLDSECKFLGWPVTTIKRSDKVVAVIDFDDVELEGARTSFDDLLFAKSKMNTPCWFRSTTDGKLYHFKSHWTSSNVELLAEDDDEPLATFSFRFRNLFTSTKGHWTLHPPALSASSAHALLDDQGNPTRLMDQALVAYKVRHELQNRTDPNVAAAVWAEKQSRAKKAKKAAQHADAGARDETADKADEPPPYRQ